MQRLLYKMKSLLQSALIRLYARLNSARVLPMWKATKLTVQQHGISIIDSTKSVIKCEIFELFDVEIIFNLFDFMFR